MTNKKSTKRALLMSALALFMCVSMLIGSTFAWFTDSVTSGVNKIVAGNLDIGVYYAYPSDVVDGDIPADAWKPVTADESIFNNDALWEPGYTEAVFLKFANEGSLALQYQMNIDILNEVIGKNNAGEDIQLSKYINSYICNNFQWNYKQFLFTQRDSATNPAGAPNPYYDTLYNAANAGVNRADNYTENALSLDSWQWIEPTETTYATLVLWMPETVGNEANHDGENVPSIDLGISVVATQYTWEKDSFGNDYDKDNAAFVSTVEDLKTAIANVKDGGTVYVNAGTYEISSQINIDGKSINIVGLGDTTVKLTQSGQKAFYIYGSKEEGNTGIDVTISNIEIVGNNAKSDIWVRTWTDSLRGDVNLTLDNVTCTSVIADNNYSDNTIINIDVQDSRIGKITLDASPFNNNGHVTYTNLTYDGVSRIDSINIQDGAAQALNNITINGVNPTATGEQQPKTYVDTIDELQTALNSADDGATIVFGADITGNVVMPSNAKDFTVDGEGHKLNGSIDLNGTSNKIIKNITIDAAYAGITRNGKGDSIRLASIFSGGDSKPTVGARNVVIDHCHFTGSFTEGYLGAAIAFTDQNRSGGGSGNITIKNCTFDTKNSAYDIYGYYCGAGTNGYGAFVIENNTFKTENVGGPVYIGRYASSVPVVVKGNVFENKISLADAVYVQDHSNYGVSINAENNTFSN